ncbi:MAG TPA: peptide-N4-asparagine amidase, partial [Alloacidobacterium sp.]|nr:peptide-N4-asparagine amidase [Alloacidobacterium sp.]
GIDPYLWEPIPGVQTLDFKPYRVDLTPFAGVLSDGNPHVVGVGVYNANSYFLATANLLVSTDPGKHKVTGGILSNDLATPNPVVTENIEPAVGPTFTGTISVASDRSFAISGYVNTSHGRVVTTVEQSIHWLNNQQFDVSPTTDIQNVQQTSTVDSSTSTHEGPFVTTNEQHFSYPLTLDFSYVVNPDGSFYQTTTSSQKDLETSAQEINGFKVFESRLDNKVNATDTLNWDSSGNFLGPSGSTTTQIYRSNDSLGNCYSRTLTASAQKLASVTDGQGCDDHRH